MPMAQGQGNEGHIMGDWVIGIIGGSGLYQVDGLEDARWVSVDTPWGKPSDDVLTGAYRGHQIRVPAAPWPGPSHRAQRAEQPGQYRRDETHGRNGCAVHFRRRFLT